MDAMGSDWGKFGMDENEIAAMETGKRVIMVALTP